MGRIVALDIGTVRIGVAASDPLGTFAQGVGVLAADGPWLDELAEIVDRCGASAILAGVPRRTDGTDGPEASRIRETIKRVAARFPSLEIIEWDERFTTVIATQALIEADMSRKDRRKHVDKVAAVLLLQNYLDSKRDAPMHDLMPPMPSEPRRGGRASKRRQ